MVSSTGDTIQMLPHAFVVWTQRLKASFANPLQEDGAVNYCSFIACEIPYPILHLSYGYCPCCALRCLLISMSSCYGSYCFYSLNWWVAWDVIIWIILILNKILSSPNHNFQFIWFYLLLFSITYWRREIMLCLILISLTQKI